MNVQIREFAEKDYLQCEELVNQAWCFDSVFQPEALAKLAKKMYTRGSVNESTYRTVAEVDGKVVGFIFGLNQHDYKPRLNLGYRLSTLWDLLNIKSSTPSKKEVINAISVHEQNRSQLVEKQRSEIVLFVVDKEYQGLGIGKQLWSGFLENCVDSKVEKIVVETNKLGAATFYETLGFEYLADFDSPLHEFATPNGQACVYQYHCKHLVK